MIATAAVLLVGVILVALVGAALAKAMGDMDKDLDEGAE